MDDTITTFNMSSIKNFLREIKRLKIIIKDKELFLDKLNKDKKPSPDVD